MPSIPICLPHALSVETFLAEYWQQKPLLIRQGLPQLIGMLTPEDILGLALEPEVTARLLTQSASKTSGQPQWQLTSSPLSDTVFDELPELWTVLIQNMEQWSPELGQLWQAFEFVPQWQRDDIMVSYAPKGGSVGKHYDDYDVFLAQGYGSRRWQLGKYCDETTEFIADEPIRVFDEMGEILFDEVLHPGDVLYVPPKLSHYGVAQDHCLTFSFGCRRPNLMQVLDSLADIATNDQQLFVPMRLPQAPQPSGALQESSIAAVKAQLLDLLGSTRGDAMLRDALSEVVSKRQYDAVVPEEVVSTEALRQALVTGATIQADYSNRLIYTQHDGVITLYANGQRLDGLNAPTITLLKRLADGEPLGYRDLDAVNVQTVSEWIENGWAWVAAEDERQD